MSIGEQRGMIDILANRDALAAHVADCRALLALHAPPAPPPASAPPVSAAPPKPLIPPSSEPAALLTWKSDRRGGWIFQRVPGAKLFGDDDRAKTEGRLFSLPIDAATMALDLDAAIARAFGSAAFPPPTDRSS